MHFLFRKFFSHPELLIPGIYRDDLLIFEKLLCLDSAAKKNQINNKEVFGKYLFVKVSFRFVEEKKSL